MIQLWSLHAQPNIKVVEQNKLKFLSYKFTNIFWELLLINLLQNK